ncbi:MAG: glycosyltransferase family 39 protein [Alphaproteobacteria bacterium]|nr:glycosyltransferase family 39 protein [Alphaproteobacteria bacterium]
MMSALPSGTAAANEATIVEHRFVRLNLIGFAAYCLFVLLAKWIGFSAAVFDHAKEIYHAQELRWIYDAANPPLYTWLLHGFQHVFGVRLATTLILNQLLLFLIFVSSFVLARRVLGAPVPAALAAWSLMLVGQYHKFLYTMSHSLLAAIFCPLMLWLLLRIAAERRLSDYAAAGVVLALGLLSKFLFLAAFLAAVIAALSLRAMRPGVLNPKFALTLAIAAAVFVPFVVAGKDQWSRLTSIFRSRSGADQAASYLAGLADGLGSFSASVAEYGVALAVTAALAIWLPIGVRQRLPAEQVASKSNPDNIRFVGHVVLAGLVLVLVAVLAAGVSIIKPRFVHIFLFPLPILAVAFVAARRPGGVALRRYGLLLGLIGAGILAVRVVNTTAVCTGRCEDLVPVDRLSKHLVAAGFRQGTIFAHGVRLGGNLVLRFPGSRVDVAVDPFAPASPPAGRRGQCLIVWEDGAVRGGGMPATLLAAAGVPSERAKVSMRSITLDWRWHGVAVVDPGRGWRPRRTTWRYILLPDGTPSCR